jgi:hypothetical protein
MLPLLRACRSPPAALLRAGRLAQHVAPQATLTPAATAAGLPANARMRLKEAADARGLSLEYREEGKSGEQHQPVWHVSVHVRNTGGAPVTAGRGTGPRLRDAQEGAAAAALASWDALLPSTPAAREALAVVGDAALDALLVLLAHERGLSAPQIDALRQRLLSNQALGEGAAGRAVATTTEADVGQAVLQDKAALTQMLLAAVRRAAPKLAADLEAAVRDAS